jgi:hypothetical protein
MHSPQSSRIERWNGKPLDLMTREELVDALCQSTTMIAILAGDVAREMSICACPSCVDEQAARYFEQVGRAN